MTYSGVPFKYSSTITTHNRFVQDVQFSPSGDAFASVGSDMKAFIYNGQTGETLGELTGAHKGSIVSHNTSKECNSAIYTLVDGMRVEPGF